MFIFGLFVVVFTCFRIATATANTGWHTSRAARTHSQRSWWTKYGYLNTQNAARAQHNASDLSWSTELASLAQQWASTCQFQHSNGTLMSEPYGENLAAGAGHFSSWAASNVFLEDESAYDPQDPAYNHFTQVVWKSTTEIGCAVSYCDNIFDAKYGMAAYHVCLYYPAGNVVGQVSDNVQV